jgi:hypothetical protein
MVHVGTYVLASLAHHTGMTAGHEDPEAVLGGKKAGTKAIAGAPKGLPKAVAKK